MPTCGVPRWFREHEAEHTEVVVNDNTKFSTVQCDRDCGDH